MLLSLRDIAKVQDFDMLPEDALVRDTVAAEILSISVQTLRREKLVPARKISGQRQGRRVGDIRELVRKSLVRQTDNGYEKWLDERTISKADSKADSKTEAA
jgi:hypothetical protein